MPAATERMGEERDSASETLPIVAQLCAVYGVTIEEIRGKTREMRYAWPRQVLCYLLRKRLGWTLADIGAFIGRDHSTVHHAISKVERRMRADRDERELVDSISRWTGHPASAEERALRNVEEAAERIAAAMHDALVVMTALEAKARDIRRSIESPAITRGAA